jgi:hypothetical protein
VTAPRPMKGERLDRLRAILKLPSDVIANGIADVIDGDPFELVDELLLAHDYEKKRADAAEAATDRLCGLNREVARSLDEAGIPDVGDELDDGDVLTVAPRASWIAARVRVLTERRDAALAEAKRWRGRCRVVAADVTAEVTIGKVEAWMSANGWAVVDEDSTIRKWHHDRGPEHGVWMTIATEPAWIADRIEKLAKVAGRSQHDVLDEMAAMPVPAKTAREVST